MDLDAMNIENNGLLNKTIWLNSFRFFGFLSIAVSISMVILKGAIPPSDLGVGFIVNILCVYFITSRIAVAMMPERCFDSWVDRWGYYCAIFLAHTFIINLLLLSVTYRSF